MSEGEPKPSPVEEISVPDVVPRINQESGLFEDERGRWGGNKYFGEADMQYLSKRKDRIRFIDGFGVNQNRSVLFNLEDAKLVLDERSGDVKVNELGFYNDSDGLWGSRQHFGYSDFSYLEKKGIRTIQGIGRTGRPTTLFNLEDAKKALEERESLPQVQAETGIFEDESGTWGSTSYFGKSDTAYLKDQGVRIRTRSGRAANGNIATLFNIEDGKRALQERDGLPQVDIETGLVVDETGRWGGRKIFKPKEIEYLKKRNDIVRFKKGRVNGSVAFLFNLEDAKKALEERESLPQVQADTGIFEDDVGGWGSKKYFGTVDTNYLRNRKKNLRTKTGRSSNGDTATLYNIEDARRVLAERDSRHNQISPDEADEMMRRLEAIQ